tara:strand:+ start:237 stop:497 length:261 start_codon:yes stop_codon:yes gene_type:complete
MSYNTTINIQNLIKAMSKLSHDDVVKLGKVIFPNQQIPQQELLVGCAKQEQDRLISMVHEGMEYQNEHKIEEDLKNFSANHGVIIE